MSIRLWTILAFVCAAIAAPVQTAARADPDRALEALLSEVSKATLLDSFDIYNNDENLALARSSTDLDRAERFMFQRGVNLDRLARKYKGAAQNDYIELAYAAWLDYLDWFKTTTTPASGGAAVVLPGSREHQAAQYYLALVQEFQGVGEFIQKLETGAVSQDVLNDEPIEKWWKFLAYCPDWKTPQDRSKSICACHDQYQTFSSVVGSWVQGFRLTQQRKDYFRGIATKANGSQCSA